jgi:pimeloyl-ACP methyl ester carboxylesterase
MARLKVGLLLLYLGLGGRLLAQQPPAFVPGPCPFLVVAPEVDGETIVCGTLDVPESRQGLSDNTITLAVAIVRSTSPSPGVPVLYFEGGPGGSAMSSAASYWVSSGLREYADIILLDQRGTGYSLPSLNCPEVDDPDLPADADAEALCRERLLREGVAIAAYTSAENAADAADLVQALDLPQVNLFGVSYGTRLALTMMRDYPERIRAVILDAVYPPQVNGYDEQAANGARAFEQLFADCEADAECRAAYPDLRAVFLQMIGDLNEVPMRGVDDYGDPAELFGDTVVNELFQLLYDTAAIPDLPLMIMAAAERDYNTYASLGGAAPDDLTAQLEAMSDEEFDAYVAQYLSFATVEDYLAFVDTLSDDEYNDLLLEVYNQGSDISEEEQQALDERLLALTGLASFGELYDYLAELSDDDYYALLDEAYGVIDDSSEGMFNSVECYEEVPFNRYETAEALAADLNPSLATALLYDVEGMFATCEMWGIPQAPALENEPVTRDIPTLVLSGTYDPITPPAWGQAAADALPRSTHVVFPGVGHGAVDTLPCPTQIALRFLEQPQQPVDTACVAAMTPPRFTLP